MKLYLFNFLFFLLAARIGVGQELLLHKNDFAPDEPDSIISKRLESLDTRVPLAFNSHVRRFIDFYTIKRRDYVRRMINKKDIYFPVFEKYLAKYDMPDEIKYLSIVESALNPKAVSPAGAVGLWQFMPSTGKIYKLNYDTFIDERSNIEKSTDAACQYLKQLHGMFNDWELAIAAYNCGPGNIRKAKRRSGKNTFWGIYNYLPRETRSYVPHLIGVIYAVNYAEEHNLFPTNTYFKQEAKEIEVTNYFNFEEFAKSLNICLEDLMQLNPTVKHNVIPDYIPKYTIKYPSEKEALLLEKPELIANAHTTRRPKDLDTIKPGPEKIYHRIRSGESLGSIARKYRVYTKDLKRWNRIRGSRIYAGKKLVIYKRSTLYPAYSLSKSKTTSSATVTTASAKPQTTQVKEVKKLAANQTNYHIVRAGETLWSISQQYEGLTVTQIKKLNGLYSNRIYKGQKLKLNY